MTDKIQKLFSLAGKTVLVTGASRGIGAAIALGCQNAGAQVTCLARSKKPQSDLLLPFYKQCDIEDTVTFKKICETVVGQRGGIDGLINVAGVSFPPDPRNEYERFSKTVRINLEAIHHCCLTASKSMSRGSAIVNVASIGGILGFPNNPGYVASKGGLRLLTKALAVDLGDKAIRANCILPGYIKTAMTASSFNDKKLRRERTQKTILNRWGTPEDLVGGAIFLTSDAASYITGIDLTIDGGWTAKGL